MSAPLRPTRYSARTPEGLLVEISRHGDNLWSVEDSTGCSVRRSAPDGAGEYVWTGPAGASLSYQYREVFPDPESAYRAACCAVEAGEHPGA